MTTVFVTYPGNRETHFNREYYVAKHIPLVKKIWGAHGLETIAAFFPAGEGDGVIAVCVCGFRDDAAVTASLQDPQTKVVMDDVQHFTNAKPSQLRATPL